MREETSDEALTDLEEETNKKRDDPYSSYASDVDIKRSRRKALLEFRFRVKEAIEGNYMLSKNTKKDNHNDINNMKDIALWGVPLMSDEAATEAILSKFLKAKRYKVHEAFTLLRKTLKWREEFRPDEDLSRPETANMVMDHMWFSSGKDKEGRPLCYNVLGNNHFNNTNNILSSGEKYQDYLRWRISCVEMGIHDLDFSPGGVDSIIQITDMKNSPGPSLKEVHVICKKLINVFRDHYPGLVYRNLIINVPSWFMTLNALKLRLITQRSKKKFVFVKPSKVTETLLKYATIENIPIQYGGLKRENDAEFSTDDKVLEMDIKTNARERIQIPVNEEGGVTVTWDVTVVGYEVTYEEEFVPYDDCSYRILIQKEKKMEHTVRNYFHVREPGNIVITFINCSYTKKKVYYRYKTRPTMPIYVYFNK